MIRIMQYHTPYSDLGKARDRRFIMHDNAKFGSYLPEMGERYAAVVQDTNMRTEAAVVKRNRDISSFGKT